MKLFFLRGGFSSIFFFVGMTLQFHNLWRQKKREVWEWKKRFKSCCSRPPLIQLFFLLLNWDSLGILRYNWRKGKKLILFISLSLSLQEIYQNQSCSTFPWAEEDGYQKSLRTLQRRLLVWSASFHYNSKLFRLSRFWLRRHRNVRMAKDGSNFFFFFFTSL